LNFGERFARHPLVFAKRRQVIEIGPVALRSFAAGCKKVQKSAANGEKSLGTRSQRARTDAEN